jgi:hypothetical protein
MIVLLVIGNIVSYVLNGRTLFLTTNIVMLVCIVLNFYSRGKTNI